MFFEPASRDHGLPFDPFKSCVIPRPIGWISTVSADGIRNLAPFSFFNAMSWAPPIVAFGTPGRDSAGHAKDTLLNIEATGEFVVNMATLALADAVALSGVEVDADVDEFELTGLQSRPASIVKAPMVAASPINFECKLVQIVTLPSRSKRRTNAMVLGEVVGVHIDDSVIVDGRIDLKLVKPIARLGYQDWAVIDNIFSKPAPVVPTRQDQLARDELAKGGNAAAARQT